MTNYKELIREATQLLDKFQANKHCVDTFIEDAGKNLKNLHASDKKFVLDVVHGCILNKRLIDVAVNIFYDQNERCLLRADRNQFAVVCCLAMFHLEDHGLQCFSRIVKSLDTSKMHKFLSFFFNVTNLTTWIQSEWNQIYDASYVESNWIVPLLRWHCEIEPLLEQLASQMKKGNLPKISPKKHTEPQEFALTKPKPRPLPAPEPIPHQEKTQPVPASTYRAPKEMQILEEVKQKNHQKSLQTLYEANSLQFTCANPQMSQKTKKVISQILESRDAELKFDARFTSGAPATHKMQTKDLKLNRTAILRGRTLYNRQMEEELLRLNRLAEGAKDPTSFLQWQREMQEKDLQEQLAQLERRKLEGQISHEETVQAQNRILELNQQKAQRKKEETAELMRRYAKKRLQEEVEMKELVQQVTNGHKNSKATKAKLQEIKQQIVREVSEQSRELLQQALEEAQAELNKKIELIHQIRAIESVPISRYKFLDDTETAGHGLLCEMSLVELRERLARLKDSEQRRQKEQRQKIIEDKHVKERLLLDQMDEFDLYRKALKQASEQRRAEKAAAVIRIKKVVSEDERVLALQRTLEMKRQEREKKKREREEKKQNERTKAKESQLARRQELGEHLKLEEHEWQELEENLRCYVEKECLAVQRNTYR
ncbi:cilia- and flagella-associated protein 99 [Chanos chanos]|uniref:Cilia- and flagella-associated protein 99 n=1 Tax=Chanos chanos TaxID=29144 RepID=A0A6J2WG31_CHACN|nr:cilia- and flagella-associated protein 99 [Chanos chanos]